MDGSQSRGVVTLGTVRMVWLLVVVGGSQVLGRELVVSLGS
jgi:hypothetical protein